MVLEWSQSGPVCGGDPTDKRYTVVSKVHYLHFAIILAAITSVVIVVVSLFTKPRSEAQVSDLNLRNGSIEKMYKTQQAKK